MMKIIYKAFFNSLLLSLLIIYMYPMVFFQNYYKVQFQKYPFLPQGIEG